MANNALLYVRVSSADQEKEGYSLDAQERLGHEYALRKELQILKTWKISESAWRSERDAFNQMIDYSKRHPEIGHIIFDVTDRMTRNDFDKLKIYTLIKEHSKTIHFSRSNKTFNKDSGTEDEFMLDIEVAVAKKMSNDISRKTHMGMLEKAEQGLFPSLAPLGYRNNPLTHLVDVDETQAPFIKRAFSLIALGSSSLDMLEKALYQEGLRSKHGKRVHKTTLHFALRNPFYYGAFRFNETTYQGSHTPLISKELFDRVQAVLSGKRHPHPTKKNFPFNNLISCGVCECKVLGERKKQRYNYYHCTFSKGRHEDGSYIPEEKLADMFEEPVKNITLPPNIADWLVEALEEKAKDASALQQNRLNALQTQFQKARDRLSKLYDLRIDGELPEEVFKAKESEYKAQAIDIQAQMNDVGPFNPSSWRRGLKTLELSKVLHSQYKRADHQEKATILKLIASNYTLQNKTLRPTYRKPFNWLAEGLACTDWLPGSDSRQSTPNARNALCLWDKFDFGPIFESRGRVRLVRRKAFELHQTLRASKEPIPKPPAIQTLLTKAYDLQKTLATTPGLTRFALAKRMKVDPTRVSQILNLLHLAPRIQAYIQALEPTIHHPTISDRDWNRLARLRDPFDQIKTFEALLCHPAVAISKQHEGMAV